MAYHNITIRKQKAQRRMRSPSGKRLVVGRTRYRYTVMLGKRRVSVHRKKRAALRAASLLRRQERRFETALKRLRWGSKLGHRVPKRRTSKRRTTKNAYRTRSSLRRLNNNTKRRRTTVRRTTKNGWRRRQAALHRKGRHRRTSRRKHWY